MKKVIIPEENKITVNLEDVDERIPIFAKRDGKLIGMVVCEIDGWIIKLGDTSYAASGRYPTRKECIESSISYRYEFFIED